MNLCRHLKPELGCDPNTPEVERTWNLSWRSIFRPLEIDLSLDGKLPERAMTTSSPWSFHPTTNNHTEQAAGSPGHTPEAPAVRLESSRPVPLRGYLCASCQAEFHGPSPDRRGFGAGEPLGESLAVLVQIAFRARWFQVVRGAIASARYRSNMVDAGSGGTAVHARRAGRKDHPAKRFGDIPRTFPAALTPPAEPLVIVDFAATLHANRRFPGGSPSAPPRQPVRFASRARGVEIRACLAANSLAAVDASACGVGGVHGIGLLASADTGGGVVDHVEVARNRTPSIRRS